jgi:cystathionine gamma-synthase
MRAHDENTQQLVGLLSAHRAVRRLYYPGLATHPGHEIARRQQQAFGAMLSFELDGGLDAVRAFLGGLELFSLAESLGGVESLVAHPASMTHAAMAEAARRRAGIEDSLLRLSVGIEAGDDLVADLRSGLDAAHAKT